MSLRHMASDEAQAAGVAAGINGVPCEEVDAVTRQIITDAGTESISCIEPVTGLAWKSTKTPTWCQETVGL